MRLAGTRSVVIAANTALSNVLQHWHIIEFGAINDQQTVLTLMIVLMIISRTLVWGR